MKSSRYDQLEVREYPNRRILGLQSAVSAADTILSAIGERGEARVIFACAPSQNEFLESLTAAPIEWRFVSAFHMDEYAGISGEHPQSFRRYLAEHLLSRIGPVRAFHPIAGEAADPRHECERYGKLLAAAPIDLVCLGIGENGHLAFNDPPVADFHDPALAKVVELDASCRQQQVNDGCFVSLEAVPTHALTLTIPALMRARVVSCVVPGPRKAAAVRETLLGPVSTSCPASILRTHPRAVLHIDTQAASLLGSTDA